MRNFIFILLFSVFSNALYSQIGQEFDDVIESYGSEYEVIEGGSYDVMIRYITGEGESWKSMAFVKLGSGHSICVWVQIIEPKSEANRLISALNESGYVKLDELKWRDYENSTEYIVQFFGTGDAAGVSVEKKMFFTDTD
jgi:hypothetical protein